MAKTNPELQKEFRERMKAKGYVQRWVPRSLWQDIMKLIEGYKG